jgi:hypothetical protein
MLLRDHPLMMYRRRSNCRLFGYALPDTINTRKAKSERSKRFSGLIGNRQIVAFFLFAMKTQSISAVYYSTTRRSVIKSWSY